MVTLALDQQYSDYETLGGRRKGALAIQTRAKVDDWGGIHTHMCHGEVEEVEEVEERYGATDRSPERLFHLDRLEANHRAEMDS